MNQYPLPHSPFFLVSCGCIGLDIGYGQWTAIKRCDAEYDDDQPAIELDTREYDPDKTYEPLSLDATKAILENLGSLVRDGHRMDDVRRALGGTRVALPYRVSVQHPNFDYDKVMVVVEKTP